MAALDLASSCQDEEIVAPVAADLQVSREEVDNDDSLSKFERNQDS